MLRPRASGIMSYLGGAIEEFRNPVPERTDPRTVIPMGQGMGPVPPMMPTAQPMTSMNAPQATSQMPFRAGGGTIRKSPMGELGSGVRMTPEQLEEQAFKAAKIQQERPDIAAEPGFMKTVSDFFGDRENMLRLAAGFNSMRFQPDQGLAQMIGSELKDIRAQKVAGKTVPAIINFLRAKGYDDYAKVVEQNPAMAKTIYEQVIQLELKPGASPKTSGVQYDSQNRAFVNVSTDGTQQVQYLKDASGEFITRQDPNDVRRLEKEWDVSIKRADEVSQKASGLENNLMLYQQALSQIANGANSGIVINRLPAFDAQTATLRSIAQQLGIQTINSATFGALSEKELELALSTNMNLSLDPDELKKQIIEKMEATEKLYLEMRKKAAEMSSMPFGEYTQLKNQRAEENAKYMAKPDGVRQETWYGMTLDQKRRFYEAGQQQ